MSVCVCLSGTLPITKNIESKFNYDSFLNSNPTMTESSTTIHERNAVARIEDKPTTTAAAAAAAAEPKGQGEEVEEENANIIEALKQQLEYYFSVQNLTRDLFLQNILASNNNSCSFETLARFANVVRICSSQEDKLILLEFAAKESKELKVHVDKDGNAIGVGPVETFQVPPVVPRNTIILREVGSDVTDADILEVFDSWDGCPVTVKTIREDVGHNW